MIGNSFKLIFLVLALLLIIVPLGCTKEVKPLTEEYNFTICAASPPGDSYLLGVKQAEIVSRSLPDVTLNPMGIAGGAIGSITRVEEGTIDFGICTAEIVQDLLTGTASFEGKPPGQNVRGYFSTGRIYYGQYVREDTGIKWVNELEGKAYAPGRPGTQGTYITERTLEVLGIAIDSRPGGYADMAAAVQDKRVVGLEHSTFPSHTEEGKIAVGAVVEELNYTVPMRHIGYTKEEASKLMAEIPGLLMKRIEPDGWKEGDPEMWVIDCVYLWGTHKDIPEDVVYRIVKTLHENYDEILAMQSFRAGHLEGLVDAMNGYDILLHPGTIKWLKELGYEIPEKAIPPEMKQ